MSHGDSVSEAPAGFAVSAPHRRAPVAAFEDLDRRLAGVQFHPEVLHTAHGQAVLEHFLYDIAGAKPTWTMTNVIDEQVAAIRAAVGDRRVLCGLSGGVDSAVAAALVQRPSATTSRASSSTTACCGRERPSRSSGTSSPPPGVDS